MNYTIEVKLKNKWTGKVVVEIPSHPARLTAIAEHGCHKIKEMNEADKNDKRKIADSFFDDQIPHLAPFYEKFCRPKIVSVDFLGPNGEIVKTIDEVDTIAGLDQVWLIVALKFVAGFGPEKK